MNVDAKMRLISTIALIALAGCASPKTGGDFPALVCDVHGVAMSLEKFVLKAAATDKEMAEYMRAKKGAFPHHGGVHYFPLPLTVDAPVCRECTAAFLRWSDDRKKAPNS